MTKTIAMIVAAGRGSRAAAPGGMPKQYRKIHGVSVLAHTLQFFLEHAGVDKIVVVIHPDDLQLYGEAIGPLGGGLQKLLAPAYGGATRQASVRKGLEAIEIYDPKLVLIHDAARMFVRAENVAALLEKLDAAPAVILGSRLTDTLKRVDDADLIVETIPRDRLWRAETPQCFRYLDIRRAHDDAHRQNQEQFTDDASLAEWAGIPVSLVESGGNNMKITTAEDLAMAARRLEPKSASLPDIRTGQGFDVHRFTTGDHVWLCGIRIPHDCGVDAHSDGDVGLHALTDALLGAIADGDIGQHFKNTDPRWKDAASYLFLADARRRVEAKGGTITNVDLTVLCEAPKIAPHRDAMRGRIAEILGLDVERVGVKATTTELMGFTGRREGLAAMATATIIIR
jgi:2-C-methyl-D-erythritol 4-phosphate cytidylyltransferase / 2-C-methyl-D-erythritol 2,4-cyclodiphosphate synthase